MPPVDVLHTRLATPRSMVPAAPPLVKVKSAALVKAVVLKRKTAKAVVLKRKTADGSTCSFALTPRHSKKLKEAHAEDAQDKAN